MSENPSNVIQLDDYRQGSRLDDSTHLDLHSHTVPKYDAEYIASVHRTEAARLAQEAAIRAEQETTPSGPERAQHNLSNLAAIRIAALNGEIRMVA